MMPEIQVSAIDARTGKPIPNISIPAELKAIAETMDQLQGSISGAYMPAGLFEVLARIGLVLEELDRRTVNLR